MEVCVRDDTPVLPTRAHRIPARDDELAGVLAALGTRVAPTALARERTLPTSDAFADLCGGLVRGRVLSCTGDAATSVALGLLAPAVAAGSWLALVDVPTIGLDAASEFGIVLERVVAVDTALCSTGRCSTGSSWADVVAAAADGFDVMIVRVPGDVPAATVRRVATRLQQRGVVMVVLGDPGALVCDGVLATTSHEWNGLGAGWGHLRRRSVEVTATGRRLPGRRTRTLTLPSPHAHPSHDGSPHDASPHDASPHDAHLPHGRVHPSAGNIGRPTGATDLPAVAVLAAADPIHPAAS